MTTNTEMEDDNYIELISSEEISENIAEIEVEIEQNSSNISIQTEILTNNNFDKMRDEDLPAVWDGSGGTNDDIEYDIDDGGDAQDSEPELTNLTWLTQLKTLAGLPDSLLLQPMFDENGSTVGGNNKTFEQQNKNSTCKSNNKQNGQIPDGISTAEIPKKQTAEDRFERFMTTVKRSAELYATSSRLYQQDPEEKPPFNYAQIIAMAMLENGRMTLQQICQWIEQKFAYYRCRKNWNNSIRHNLSLQFCFRKIDRNKYEKGKGGYWELGMDMQKSERKRIRNRRIGAGLSQSSSQLEQKRLPHNLRDRAKNRPKQHEQQKHKQHEITLANANNNISEDERAVDVLLSLEGDALDVGDGPSPDDNNFDLVNPLCSPHRRTENDDILMDMNHLDSLINLQEHETDENFIPNCTADVVMDQLLLNSSVNCLETVVDDLGISASLATELSSEIEENSRIQTIDHDTDLYNDIIQDSITTTTTTADPQLLVATKNIITDQTLSASIISSENIVVSVLNNYPSNGPNVIVEQLPYAMALDVVAAAATTGNPDDLIYSSNAIGKTDDANSLRAYFDGIIDEEFQFMKTTNNSEFGRVDCGLMEILYDISTQDF